MTYGTFWDEPAVNKVQPVVTVTECNKQERDDLDRKVNSFI